MRDLILPPDERDELERRLPVSLTGAALWFRDTFDDEKNPVDEDEQLDMAASSLENMIDLAMQIGYQRGYEYGESVGMKAARQAAPPTLHALVKRLRKAS